MAHLGTRTNHFSKLSLRRDSPRISSRVRVVSRICAIASSMDRRILLFVCESCCAAMSGPPSAGESDRSAELVERDLEHRSRAELAAIDCGSVEGASILEQR